MDIVNCVQCSRPFQRTGAHTMCGNCLDMEHARYDRYYRKLGKHLEHLNMLYLGQKTGLSGQRLANTLYFRLGNGAIKDLPLWKRGYCNICHQRLKNADSVEPICLHCLEALTPLIENDPQAIFPSDIEKLAQTAHQELSAPPLILAGQTPLEPAVTPPLSEVEQLRLELAHYKALYHAAIATQGNASAQDAGDGAIVANPDEGARVGELPPSSEDWREVQEILEADDATALSCEDLQLLQTQHRLFASAGQIRHYGFKRHAPTPHAP